MATASSSRALMDGTIMRREDESAAEVDGLFVLSKLLNANLQAKIFTDQVIHQRDSVLALLGDMGFGTAGQPTLTDPVLDTDLWPESQITLILKCLSEAASFLLPSHLTCQTQTEARNNCLQDIGTLFPPQESKEGIADIAHSRCAVLSRSLTSMLGKDAESWAAEDLHPKLPSHPTPVQLEAELHMFNGICRIIEIIRNVLAQPNMTKITALQKVKALRLLEALSVKLMVSHCEQVSTYMAKVTPSEALTA
ncbi:hypothetical protein TREMEDRAFT_59726 [Tremella mesenterica DSM 1558]|uniref:uncharacterized protein n=1 Tax=Tremella mesenterica (strain ATCC 24925 / CBS 8224 / DSM 1558 / NBRC 9311 / NRRL Y-6157 / RJB 2259-6 / UBC 559-6) TaxID=578456 RepID=UPI0003F4A3FD|nr:uncharacterized protein TREMEDRAFT_59726 [Tremella mesenterica DSM 1558]EIW73551.1 hypothetical protein TREMEDRAFT_59726 [Tremella mesenterica DSM 1558]